MLCAWRLCVRSLCPLSLASLRLSSPFRQLALARSRTLSAESLSHRDPDR